MLSIALGSVGAILILVGVVGGGFTFSGSVMPKVGGLARLLSFSAGGVLVVFALALVGLDTPSASPGPAPDPPSVGGADSGASDGGGQTAPRIALTAVDQRVVTLLQARPSFQNYSGDQVVKIEHTVCQILDNGGRGRDIVQTMTDTGASEDDAIYALAVATTAYCPSYSNGTSY